jgi:hypothetical protein
VYLFFPFVIERSCQISASTTANNKTIHKKNEIWPSQGPNYNSSSRVKPFFVMCSHGRRKVVSKVYQ